MTERNPSSWGNVPARIELESLVSSWAAQLQAHGVSPRTLATLVNDVLADTAWPPVSGENSGAEQILAETIQAMSRMPRLEEQLRLLVLYHGVQQARLLVGECAVALT